MHSTGMIQFLEVRLSEMRQDYLHSQLSITLVKPKIKLKNFY